MGDLGLLLGSLLGGLSLLCGSLCRGRGGELSEDRIDALLAEVLAVLLHELGG